MPERIRTVRDCLADLHHLFEVQAPSLESRNKWNKLVYELSDILNNTERPEPTFDELKEYHHQFMKLLREQG